MKPRVALELEDAMTRWEVQEGAFYYTLLFFMGFPQWLSEKRIHLKKNPPAI